MSYSPDMRSVSGRSHCNAEEKVHSETVDLELYVIIMCQGTYKWWTAISVSSLLASFKRLEVRKKDLAYFPEIEFCLLDERPFNLSWSDRTRV